jgi:putative hydrolase of the HAD superfamily|tara:strand:+ start:309 stop:1019 length:711 start_codon:yes stop_codon:yes gene_type:complete
MIKNEISLKKGWAEVQDILLEKSYNHRSFDFWRTIAYSNPKFKLGRSKILIDNSNEIIDEKRVNTVFCEVGGAYNDEMESTNKIKTPFSLYKLVLDQLNVRESNWEGIYTQVNELFLMHPPIIGSQFKSILPYLKDNDGTNSITSNTAFVPGDVIKEFINNSSLKGLFNFMIFSDKAKTAKPNESIYHLMVSELKTMDVYSAGMKTVHIGDNYLTDYQGAENFGIKGILVEGDEKY